MPSKLEHGKTQKQGTNVLPPYCAILRTYIDGLQTSYGTLLQRACLWSSDYPYGWHPQNLQLPLPLLCHMVTILMMGSSFVLNRAQ